MKMKLFVINTRPNILNGSMTTLKRQQDKWA